MLSAAARVGPAPQLPPLRPVTVTALLDATSRDIAPNVLHTLSDFKRAAERAPTTRFSVQAYSGATTSASLQRRAFVTKLMPFGLAAAGLAAAWAIPNPAAALGLAAISLAGTAMLYHKLKPAVDDLALDADKFAQLVPVPHWKGRQEFHIQAGHTLAQAAGPVDRHATAPNAGAFSQQLLADMRAYPGARHVVYVFGHGLGFHMLAGMRMSDVSAALAHASGESGEPIDALVGESCLMGNLETLAWLPPSVHTAVLSEPPVNIETYLHDVGVASILTCDRAYRWDGMAPHLGTTDDMGGLFLDQFASRADNMMSGIDVGTFRARLLPALDALGSALNGELARGRQPQLRGAMKSAAVVDKDSRYRDLGSFLDALGGADVRPATRQAAAAAREALAACVRTRRTGDEKQTEKLSGVSFQTSAHTSLDRTGWMAWMNGVEGYDHYGEVPLPSSWKKFIAAMS